MRSPLHPAHEARGARFAEEFGWEMPASFGVPLDEYRAVRSGAGLIDLCHRSRIALTGPDAANFLQGLLSCDVRPLAQGQCSATTLLDARGRLLADGRLIRMGEERYLLDLEPGMSDSMMQHLERHLVSEKVELQDARDELGLISIHGPEAAAILEELFGDEVPWRGPCSALERTFGGASVCVMASGAYGEQGYDLLCPAALTSSLWEALLEHCGPIYDLSLQQRPGQQAWDHDFDRTGSVAPVGTMAQELLRVEAGQPRLRLDTDEKTLPLEAALDLAVSLSKGCYLGQEGVSRLVHQGHLTRKLTGLVLEDLPGHSGGEGDAVALPARGTRLLEGERDVGWLTTAVHSPARGVPIALGYVRLEHRKAGTRLTLAGGGLATTEDLPFYRR